MFEHARELLAPGGRFLVVGLARASTPADYLVDALSILLNPVMGLAKSVVRRAGGEPAMPRVGAGDGSDTEVARDHGMPVRDPAETFTAVACAAATTLPGVRVRRRLWFRYCLAWTAP